LKYRRRQQIALGNGEDKALLKRIRAHGNFAEYTPIAIIMAAFVELQQAPHIVTHIACATLLIGRVSHAYGLSQLKEDYRFRVTGMAFIFASLVTSILTVLMTFISHLL
jgi:uncharacterized membrane protein YecN with MAPEG domain